LSLLNFDVIADPDPASKKNAYLSGSATKLSLNTACIGTDLPQPSASVTTGDKNYFFTMYSMLPVGTDAEMKNRERIDTGLVPVNTFQNWYMGGS
jgi:hypothetical protein